MNINYVMLTIWLKIMNLYLIYILVNSDYILIKEDIINNDIESFKIV